jgi:hypothetical protein
MDFQSMSGPFNMKHLIVGGLIILATAVAMFMLKGILSFGFVIPLWMIVIIIISIMVIIAILILTILGYLRYGAEGFLFAKARKTGVGIGIDAELGSLKCDFYLMEKVSPKDVVLKDETCGVKVDPAMLDTHCKPMAFAQGLDIYITTYYNYMAQSLTNHAAFKIIEDDFETNPKRAILRFLSLKEYTELLSDPEHYLTRNATIKLNKYFKQREAKDADGNIIYLDTENTCAKITHVRRYDAWIDDFDDNGKPIVVDNGDGTVSQRRHWGHVEEDVSISDMLDAIYTARHEINQMPIPGCKIVGIEAFKNNSVAYSSQHLGHVLMLYYTKMMEDIKGQIETWMYIIGLVAIIGAIGVSVYIASMAFKGSGS